MMKLIVKTSARNASKYLKCLTNVVRATCNCNKICIILLTGTYTFWIFIHMEK
jgi:hypothetical protein